MSDLNALLVFAKVVEANSFSEAARRLKMPVSTVSRRVADLEDELGVRLLERSTRNLRLTDVGAELVEQARRSSEISDAVEEIVSNKLSKVSGLLRLSAPPNISDSLLVPLVSAFQASYPDVSVQVFLTERFVDHISEGIDLAFRIGAMKDSNLITRKILRYRQQLVAAPAYLRDHPRPEMPQDLLAHRLVSFLYNRPENGWTFHHANGTDRQTLTFAPALTMNDYNGIAAALLAGMGIGLLPPIVQPELLRSGRLVEVMPDWRFRSFDLSLVHLGSRNIARPVRVFKDFAMRMAPTLFPDLPE